MNELHLDWIKLPIFWGNRRVKDANLRIDFNIYTALFCEGHFLPFEELMRSTADFFGCSPRATLIRAAREMIQAYFDKLDGM